MCSRVSASFLSLLVVSAVSLLALSGCNQVFNKTPAKVAAPTPDLGFKSQCLSEVLPVMEGFMDSTATPQEVGGAWDCFGNGLTLFAKMVRSDNANSTSFTPRQVADFFQFYFFSNLKVDDVLLAEVMRFKQLFVGGSSEIITHQELLKLVDFSKQMKKISLAMLPYMKVYTKNWVPTPNKHDQNMAYFQKATDTIQLAVQEIAGMIILNNQSYTIANISNLFHSLQTLWGKNWVWLHGLDSSLPLIEDLKNSLVGGDPARIYSKEWDRLGFISSRGYMQFLRYFYFVSGSSKSGIQLAYVSETAADLFSFLRDLVSKKPSGSFKAIELKDILDKVNKIFPTAHLTDKLVDDFMKFKIPIFGGTVDEFLPEDFERASNKVGVLQTIIANVVTYQDLYTMEWNRSRMTVPDSQKFFADSRVALVQSSHLLATFMESGYDLKYFSDFIDDVSDVLESPQTKVPWLDKVKLYLPTLIAYKQIALADSGTIIQKNEWENFFGLTARFYGSALLFNYYVAKQSLDKGPALDNLDSLVPEVAQTLSDMLKYRAKKNLPEISSTEIVHLAMTLQSAGILPAMVSKNSLQVLVRALTQKLLVSPQLRLNKSAPDGFANSTVAWALSEYNVWSAGQHALREAFSGGAQRLSTKALHKSLLQQDQSPGVVELEHIFAPYPPLTVDVEGRMYLGYSQQNYDLPSTSSMNISRALARLLIHGYVTDLDRADDFGSGITQNEFDDFFSDVKPVAVDMGLLSGASINFSSSRFLEANMFMPASNGDDFVSVVEATELLTFMRSGLQLSAFVNKKLSAQCLVQKGALTSNADRLGVDCVLDFYQRNISTVLSSMPDMVNYLGGLSDQDFRATTLGFLKSAGWNPSDDSSTVSRSDLALLPHVFQYAESVMQRYDINQDNILDDSEAEAAYPLYKNLLMTFSKNKSDLINKSAFYFMLKNGRVPCGFFDLAVVYWKVWHHHPVNVNADRMRLSSVFGAIADSVRNGGTKAQCDGKGRKDLDPPPGYKSDEDKAP